ncbi:MAG: hypothetical protein ABR501_08630, partial [Pyrinomonadaceae bacterium]
AQKLAEEYFQKAGAETRVRNTILPGGKRQNSTTASVAPLFRSSAAKSRKLISGGDRRMADALREDALSACNSTDV